MRSDCGVLREMIGARVAYRRFIRDGYGEAWKIGT
jgi:hypothetical protein